MTIGFSEQELEILRRFFNKIDAGETQKHLHELPQAFPEWNTIFLLLRKLLAYGVYYSTQADQKISYEELQRKTQKPNDMLVNIQHQFDQFNNLLAMYVAHHK